MVAEPLSPRFGEFGGRYIPETLVAAHEELEVVYAEARADPEFHRELEDLYAHYVGRPTPLYFAERLTRECGGARIWLKREDLAHTGAHKINNALGQALLAKRLGKPRIIAETGAGQHGVATATVCVTAKITSSTLSTRAASTRRAATIPWCKRCRGSRSTASWVRSSA